MIFPLTDETAWMSALCTLPVWTPPWAPTIIIAPHPDDETLAAGGLIAMLCERGVSVTVVAVTDGEKAYGDQPDAALAELRKREQLGALTRLGVRHENIVRLHLPDSEVSNYEAAIVQRILPLLQSDLRVPTSHIIAPWIGDFHPDHEACGRAAQQLARLTGAQLSFWFFWTWHRGTVQTLKGLGLQRLPLNAQQQSAKAEALQCHSSQLHREEGEPILPGYLLQPARRAFEVFLPA